MFVNLRFNLSKGEASVVNIYVFALLFLYIGVTQHCMCDIYEENPAHVIFYALKRCCKIKQKEEETAQGPLSLPHDLIAFAQRQYPRYPAETRSNDLRLAGVHTTELRLYHTPNWDTPHTEEAMHCMRAGNNSQRRYYCI